MGGIKLSVHPLFFVFGFYYALTGRIFEFVIYTVTAVIHELGHSFAAARAGYRLDRMVLMPFGAVVKGNIDGMKPSDEIGIALAGPFINLATGIFFVAVWWIFPEIYAFTDIAASANFTMAVINFIPAYPLDGGRILSVLIGKKTGEDRAFRLCRILGVVFGLLIMALFVLSCFRTVNLSLLFFGLFVLAGALGRAKDNVYVRMYPAMSEERLMRGMPYNRIAVTKRMTVKKLMRLLDYNAVNEVSVFDGEKKVALLSQKDINKIIENGDIYSTLEKFILND